MAKLSDKQQRFVDEYLVDLNATQAAKRAGYAEPNKQGPRLLVNVGIKDAIDRAKAKRDARTELTQDRVVEELAKIGFSDIRNVVQWGRNPSENAESSGDNLYPVSLVPSEQISDDTAATVSEVSLTQAGVKVKMYDKMAALKLLYGHLAKDHGGVAPALNINITTREAVGDVRVTNAGT